MTRLVLRRAAAPWRVVLLAAMAACSGWLGEVSSVSGKDYILTIGGGYNPSGNQASLEANVLFFQQLLADRHSGDLVHDVYFADGLEADADLQVETPPPPANLPATALLSQLHRRGEVAVEYRNHQVSGVTGANDPRLVQTALARMAQAAGAGDRLLIYVTAHGGEAKGDNPYATTISCWNEKAISLRELTEWLDAFSPEVPVVLVMAQCYCGGFAHTMFEAATARSGLSPRTRVGFFAQQHNLPAAGCRPDIEHDEEFSSYFWGAIAGRSRTGKPQTGCDADGDGRVSLDEAHGHMVAVGETIDIPLKTTDVLLRRYSAIPGYSHAEDRLVTPLGGKEEEPRAGVRRLDGTLQELQSAGTPVQRRIIDELCRRIELPLDRPIRELFSAYDRHRGNPPEGAGPGRRRNSGRRELLAAIGEKWPDLADSQKWSQSSLLRVENQDALLAELRALPSFANYEQRRTQRGQQDELAEKHELRTVKFRRLIETLESIVLQQNLPHLAEPEVVRTYNKMVQVEQTAWLSSQ